jgi:hypothetical protein
MPLDWVTANDRNQWCSCLIVVVALGCVTVTIPYPSLTQVVADNYLDGGYHVEFAHPALADGLDASSYVSQLYSNMSILSAQAVAEGDDGRLGDSQVTYTFVYPNIMINRCVHALSCLSHLFPPSSVASPPGFACFRHTAQPCRPSGSKPHHRHIARMCMHVVGTHFVPTLTTNVLAWTG